VSLHRTMRTISKRIARSEPVSTSSSSATHSVPPRSQSGGRGRGRLRQGSPKLTDTFGPRSPDWLDRRCHRRPARRSKTNTALSAMEPSTGAVRVSPVSETSRRCCPRGLTVTNAVAHSQQLRIKVAEPNAKPSRREGLRTRRIWACGTCRGLPIGSVVTLWIAG
jgi:hypothetical protein